MVTTTVDADGLLLLQQKAQAYDEMKKAGLSVTARPTVLAIDALLGERFDVLDHGFVRVVDYMGSDSSIVQMARVSYGRGTKSRKEDRGLIRYLMKHRHTSPFEGCEIKLHVKLPIFVARQWIRHRTANVNEASARYSILDKEFYQPAREHLQAQSQSNKQGRGETVGDAEAAYVLDLLKEDAEKAFCTYEDLLNEGSDDCPKDASRFGLARELARIGLPLSTYTQWYWKCDLHNLFHFLGLRADSHAQFEIRAYAKTIMDLVRQWCPLALEAFEDYRLGAATLSRQQLEALRALTADMRGAIFVQPDCVSEREFTELLALLKLEDGGVS